MSERTILQLPLGQLDHHHLNVRKYPDEKTDQPNSELMASIRSSGLLKNLVVIPSEDSESPVSHLVIAGGRRLDAMRNIVDDGHDPEWVMDREVICLCLTDLSEADIVEISLAENDIRLEVSTADEIEAFAVLVAEGLSPKEIATRFGYVERTILQRLGLATVHPELRQKFREGEITLGALKEFAVVEGHNEQVEVWNALMARREDEDLPNWQRATGTVRQNEVYKFLSNRRGSAGNRTAIFVGLEAYQAAGGRIETDLFGDHDQTFLLDLEILEKLAKEKLDSMAEGLKLGEVWAWAETMFDFGYREEENFVVARKSRADPTEEQAALLAELRAHKDDAEAAEPQDWDRSEKMGEKIDALNKEIRTRDAWPEETLATAGCMISISHAGSLKVTEGLWRKDEVPRGAKRSNTRGATAYGSSVSKKAKLKGPLGLGEKPLIDLRRHRTDVIRTALTVEAARDLTEYQMVMQVFAKSFSKRSLDIRFIEDHKATGSEEEVYGPLSTRLEALPLEWIETDDPWAEWMNLDREHRDELFAAATSTILIPQLSIDRKPRPEFEHLARELGIDWASVRPTPELLYNRLTKPNLLTFAKTQLGAKFAKTVAKLPKAALVEAVADEFENFKRKKVEKFTLPGFAPKS